MKAFLQSFFWLIMGVVADRVYDYLLYPWFLKVDKKREIVKKRKLYYGTEAFNKVNEYYENSLCNCRIHNCSRQIPFLTHPSWDNIEIDVISNPQLLQFVETTTCNYPIRNRMIKKRIRHGQQLEDNPSLFLHRIVVNNNGLYFEAGEYQYFRRISFINDFETETYKNTFSGKKKYPLRDAHLPKISSGSITTSNTVPFGCDAVVAIKIKEKYHICINERSQNTVNYPGVYMTVPSFGFGSIKKAKNPLLYSFFKEYSEELFDREEMSSPDNYINPEWFYEQYEEIQSAISSKKTGEFQLMLTGCGFDVIGGFFNLSLLAVIDNPDISSNIFKKCKGNWETHEHNIQFVPIDSPKLSEYLLNNKISPSSAYTISRAISILT